MKKITFIEDNVVPQLFTTAIEAYEFKHKSRERSKGFDKLETFGLLWGFSIPAKGVQPAKVIATMATVETSAVRHEDWVQPDFESILAKKKFFERYWPNIELVGTFHSHPYNNLKEVKEIKGWRGSEEDEGFWPHFHKEIVPEQKLLTHLVITIAKLTKKGWAYPDQLQGSEVGKGYVLSADNRKLWIRSYSTQSSLNNDDEYFYFCDDMSLEIPALQKRFLEDVY